MKTVMIKHMTILVALTYCAITYMAGSISIAADGVRDTPEQSGMKEVVTNFLAATAKSDTEKANSYLAEGFKADMIGEFKSKAASGWVYSPSDTEVESATVSDGKGTLIIQIVFKGGGTFMVNKRTFSLLREKDAWKISKIDPSPTTASPGFRPL